MVDRNPLSLVLALLRRKRVWIPLGLFIAYALFGFLALPGILRGQIIQGVRKTGREIRLERVRVNPIFLSLTLEGFELRDPDGTPFVAFRRFFADFQLSSLVRMALTFREFRLDGLQVHVRLMPDGSTNFADLVPKESGKPPRLVIGGFQIHDGSVRATNLMGDVPEEATFAPIELKLENFTTIPKKEGAYSIVATDQGNGAWQWTGDLRFEPMHSAGVLEVSGSRLRALREIVRRRLGFEITDGRLGCRLEYEVGVHGDSLVARVHDSSLAITGFALGEKGGDQDLLKFDSLAVTGVQVRYPEQSAQIGRVLLAGTRIRAWLKPDTTLNWLAVLPPAVAPAKAATASGGSAPSPSSTPAPDWNVTLGELAVRDLGLDFEDRTTHPTFEASVAPVNVTIRNISSRPGATFDVRSDVTIAEKGKLTVSGTVAAQPPAADLEVSLADLPLAIFQPYLNPVAKLNLVAGTLGVRGAVHFREGTQDRPDLSFRGNVESRGLLTRDRLANERFLAWKAVQVNAIDYTPARVSVGSVRLTEPFAKLLIHKDRTTNVQEILGLPTLDSTTVIASPASETHKKTKNKKGKAAQPKASEALAAMQKNAAAAAAAPMPVRVGKIEVVRGSADFTDLSLILPFAARIESLAGTVQGLSSDTASRAAVVLDGKLQPSGTVQVRGDINPLAQDLLLDLRVIFSGFNMPTLTPYAGQFLGREIDKGRMSLDLGYRLQGRHLVGDNKMLLDNLELGSKVESPEATKLPVGLAIAILKDGEGKIDLDLPIEGDIDDPEFRIGKIIWKFILSLLTKVATAPFALLGHLLGGGGDEQLGYVDFEPGASDLPTDQQESIAKLAEVLAKRPQLSVEVRGMSDAELDAAAIRKGKFAALAGEKIASNPRRYGSGIGYSPRLLEDLYTERFGKKGFAELESRFKTTAGALKPEDPKYKAGSNREVVNQPALFTAIQDTLTTLQSADPADLLSLANTRANAIKTRLIEHSVAESRVYVLDPSPGRVEKGRIRIDLTLTD